MVASISDLLNSEIIFTSDAARLPKRVQFSEGFHASPFRTPSGKSKMYVWMSTEHWWSDTTGENRSTLRKKNLCQGHLARNTKSNMELNCNQTRASAVTGQQMTAWTMTRPCIIKFISVIYKKFDLPSRRHPVFPLPRRTH
jgi:hypothetical protein